MYRSDSYPSFIREPQRHQRSTGGDFRKVYFKEHSKSVISLSFIVIFNLKLITILLIYVFLSSSLHAQIREPTLKEEMNAIEAYSKAKDIDSVAAVMKRVKQNHRGKLDKNTLIFLDFFIAIYTGTKLNDKDFPYIASDNFTVAYDKWSSLPRELTKPYEQQMAAGYLSMARSFEKKHAYDLMEESLHKSIAMFEISEGAQSQSLLRPLSLLSSHLFKQQQRNGDFIVVNERIKSILLAQTEVDGKRLWSTLIGLAHSRIAMGDLHGAIRDLHEAIAAAEKGFGEASLQVASTIRFLSAEQGNVGDSIEHERGLLKSLSIVEKIVDGSGVEPGETLIWLARFYASQSRLDEAKSLTERAIEVYSRQEDGNPRRFRLGLAHRDLATIAVNERRNKEAIEGFEKAIELFLSSGGRNSYYVAESQMQLSKLYARDGMRDKSLELLSSAKRIMCNTWVIPRPQATCLDGAASIYIILGMFPDAIEHYERSLTLKIKLYGESSAPVAFSYSDISYVHFLRNEFERSMFFLEKAQSILSSATEKDAGISTGAFGGDLVSNVDQFRGAFEGYIQSSIRVLSRADQMKGGFERTFLTAQWAVDSDAAKSIGRMAARHATGSGELPRLMRDRQDLVLRWQAQERQLVEAISTKNVAKSDSLRDEMEQIDRRVVDIDRKIELIEPSFANLTKSDPISASEVKSLLHDDEALVFYFDAKSRGSIPEESFVWLVTKNDVYWDRLSKSTSEISSIVQHLRCGLDPQAWTDASRREMCESLTGLVDPDPRRLPFNMIVSHRLYGVLFGKLEAFLRDKKLIIVPSESTMSLPFQVLITTKGSSALPRYVSEYRTADWITKRHAISVLPSVSSLKALRVKAKRSRATIKYAGFGNPVLDGGWFWNRIAARRRQECGRGYSLPMGIALAEPPAFDSLFRGAKVDVDKLRLLPPLPDTAEELCSIGHQLGVSPHNILLGHSATERAVKQMSATGQLANFQILHFATHALVAGGFSQLEQSLAEPGIVLTPPSTDEDESDADDGLLTASEIAGLHINADLVVLSACNTAAGQGRRAKPLSGIARAFFYAGSREVLVSNWPVASSAAVQLMTKMFAFQQSNPSGDLAEALRLSTLDVLQNGEAFSAHPSYWGPFTLVGEGARSLPAKSE